MKQITFNKTFTVEEKHRDHFGEALEKHFNTKEVYGLYKRIEKHRGRAAVERAFHICEKAGDHDLSHFRQLAWGN